MIKVTGNKAGSRSAWFHVGNDNPQRSNTIGGFGHYEDDLVKVNGQWFFTKRKIFNEGSASGSTREPATPPGSELGSGLESVVFSRSGPPAKKATCTCCRRGPDREKTTD